VRSRYFLALALRQTPHFNCRSTVFGRARAGGAPGNHPVSPWGHHQVGDRALGLEGPLPLKVLASQTLDGATHAHRHQGLAVGRQAASQRCLAPLSRRATRLPVCKSVTWAKELGYLAPVTRCLLSGDRARSRWCRPAEGFPVPSQHCCRECPPFPINGANVFRVNRRAYRQQGGAVCPPPEPGDRADVLLKDLELFARWPESQMIMGLPWSGPAGRQVFSVWREGQRLHAPFPVRTTGSCPAGPPRKQKTSEERDDARREHEGLT